MVMARGKQIKQMFDQEDKARDKHDGERNNTKLEETETISF